MKQLTLVALIAAGILFFTGCQKELEFGPSTPSVGSLKSVTGSCMPSVINGIFQKGQVLTSDNFIDVNVDVTTVGDYSIKSDTLNGFCFGATGTFSTLGLNVVRLYAVGTPATDGITSFTVKYDTSKCVIDVPVQTGPVPAVFTLGGAPGNCSGFTLGSGTYKAGQVLTAANTATTSVTVTTIGTYNLGTDTVNGIYFRASGSFTVLNAQNITLIGHGTPVAAGNFNYTLKNGTNTCTFSITVTSGGPAVAAYALGNASGACTGTVLAGTYKEGQALTAANTVTIDVNVATAGTYTISTTANNGVTFSATGTFTTTGAQTVTLTGNGTPSGSGLKTHVINGVSNTCSFDITYVPAVLTAVYSLNSDASTGNCSPMTVHGTYYEGKPLDATNTVDVQVNVTTIGTYNLATTTINGMTFSASGTFTNTGVQTVTLQGTGTPINLGTVVFAPFTGTSGCKMSITTVAPPPVFSCSVDGVSKSFTFNLLTSRSAVAPPGELVIAKGYVTGSTTEYFSVAITNNLGPVVAGNYDKTSAPDVRLQENYTNDYYSSTPDDILVVKITSITATRLIGTFSGTVRSQAGTTKSITNGIFNVPLP